ncbi:MAG: hypothetical protein ACRCZI_00550 [Cetobacterium sp.]
MYQEELAKAVRLSFDKKIALLEAQKTQYFSHEGVVADERTCADPVTQLKAAEAIDRMTGALAPAASTKVTVTHSFEFPEWYMTEQQKAQEARELTNSGTVVEASVLPTPEERS